MARGKRGSAPDGELVARALTETAAGVKIRLDYYENVNDGGREEYRLDEIRAMRDGLEVGYLKITYVDQARLEKYALTPFECRMNMHDRYGTTRRLLEQGVERSQWPDDKLHQILFEVHPGHASSELQRSWHDKSHEDLLVELDSYIDQVNKEYKEQWADFQEYHVDKPVVDFIRVYKEEDIIDRQGKERQPGLGLGSGIALGQLLYEAGAEWMAMRGLKLYASAIQSPEAEKVWARMEQSHPVIMDEMQGDYTQKKTRRYLDGSGITIPGQKIDLHNVTRAQPEPEAVIESSIEM